VGVELEPEVEGADERSLEAFSSVRALSGQPPEEERLVGEQRFWG
jgi:hypothetical protein